MTKKRASSQPDLVSLFDYPALEQRHAALREMLGSSLALLTRRESEPPSTWEQKDGQVSEANSAIESVLRLFADLLPDDLTKQVYQLTLLRSRIICRGLQPEVSHE